MRSTNPNHLETWLGRDEVARISTAMRGFHGPAPIAVHGVPGNVWATNDGDFIGHCRAGEHMSAKDRAEDWLHKGRRLLGIMSRMNRETAMAHTGFASLSALIAAATTASKRQEYFWHKIGTTGVANASSSLWGVGDLPQAGTAASAAAGGRACTSSTTGALNAFVNCSGSDTQHFISASMFAGVANTLLLYDRLFDVAKTVSSSGQESVTGTPTRYTSTTAGATDYVGGNFGFIEAFAQVSSVNHNWTVCTYTDQDNSASTLPSVTGVNGAIINRLDQPTGTWYVPLAAGDVGIRAWTALQCSVNTVASAVNFCIGHPIAWIPCPIAGLMTQVDGINTAFNLVRAYDNACLSLLEVLKSATTATTYTGSTLFVQG